MKDGRLKGILTLVASGIPWDIVMNLTPTEFLGYNIIIGEFNGNGKWDFNRKTWVKESS